MLSVFLFQLWDLCPCKACRTTLLYHHFSYIVSVLPLIKPPYRSRTSPLRAHRLLSIAFPFLLNKLPAVFIFVFYYLDILLTILIHRSLVRFSISINKFSTLGGRVLTNRFIFKLFSVCIKNKSTILAISK